MSVCDWRAAKWRGVVKAQFSLKVFSKICYIGQTNPVTYFFLLLLLLIIYWCMIYIFSVHCQWIRYRDILLLVFETNFHRTLPLISSDFQKKLPAERIWWSLIFFTESNTYLCCKQNIKNSRWVNGLRKHPLFFWIGYSTSLSKPYPATEHTKSIGRYAAPSRRVVSLY